MDYIVIIYKGMAYIIMAYIVMVLVSMLHVVEGTYKQSQGLLLKRGSHPRPSH